MGRTLQNTMINLGLQNACDEAVYQVSTALRARWHSGDTRADEGLCLFVCFPLLPPLCPVHGGHRSVGAVAQQQEQLSSK